jgi:chromosome segregation ATPase
LIKADKNLENENKRLKKKIQQLEEEAMNSKEEKSSMLVELKCKSTEIEHFKKENRRWETAMKVKCVSSRINFVNIPIHHNVNLPKDSKVHCCTAFT